MDNMLYPYMMKVFYVGDTAEIVKWFLCSSSWITCCTRTWWRCSMRETPQKLWSQVGIKWEWASPRSIMWDTVGSRLASHPMSLQVCDSIITASPCIIMWDTVGRRASHPIRLQVCDSIITTSAHTITWDTVDSRCASHPMSLQVRDSIITTSPRTIMWDTVDSRLGSHPMSLQVWCWVLTL